jgi:aladin
MYVWDVAMENFVALRRMGGGGLSLVTWSPDGSKVFAATIGIIFR